MKEIEVEVNGIGFCVLRGPSIAQIKDKMHMMESDTQGFLFEVLGVALIDGKGKIVPLDLVPFTAMPGLMKNITELLGFGDNQGED